MTVAKDPPTLLKGTARSNAINPRNRALAAAGDRLFAEAIENGREFCKEMIGISTGAIAIFFAVFAWILPKDKPVGDDLMWYVIAPALAFFIAAVAFAFGYMPLVKDVNLRYLSEQDPKDGTSVAEVRNAKVAWSKWTSFIGVIAFGFGVVAAAVCYWKIASTEPEVAAPKAQSALVLNNGTLNCGTLLATEGDTVVRLQVAGLKESKEFDQVTQVEIVEACPANLAE